MTKRHSIFSILFIFLSCSLPIQAKDPELRLEYTCEIPNGLGKEVILGKKDGSTETRDAHAAYRSSHSEGWHSLMRRYADTGESTPEPEIAQTWPLMIWAHDIGGAEARTFILKAELVHGEEKVREAVQRYLKAKADSESEQAEQPAAVPQSKPSHDSTLNSESKPHPK